MSSQCITPTIGLVADQTPDHFVSTNNVSIPSYAFQPSYNHWIIVTTTHHHYHHHHHPPPPPPTTTTHHHHHMFNLDTIELFYDDCRLLVTFENSLDQDQVTVLCVCVSVFLCVYVHLLVFTLAQTSLSLQ